MRLDSTLHDDSTTDFNHLFLVYKVERVCNETRQDLSLTIQEICAHFFFFNTAMRAT